MQADPFVLPVSSSPLLSASQIELLSESSDRSKDLAHVDLQQHKGGLEEEVRIE